MKRTVAPGLIVLWEMDSEWVPVLRIVQSRRDAITHYWQIYEQRYAERIRYGVTR